MDKEHIGTELLTLLKEPTIEVARVKASEYFVGLTGSEDGKLFIFNSVESWLDAIIDNISDKNQELSKNMIVATVNLSAERTFCSKMSSSKELILKLLKYLAELKNTDVRLEFICKALSNLAQTEINALNLIDCLSENKDTFYKVLQLFYTISSNLHYFANFLSNITQVEAGRKLLTDRSKKDFSKLLTFISYSQEATRQQGVVAAVRNCCFDIDNHAWFLGPEIDILPYLLLPLAGPEEFDDEDNNLLPPELQYLEPTKERVHNHLVRKMLIESISQLCCTQSGRSYIKEKNTYVIMRELHKWETNEDCEQPLENLIQLLISDEPSDPTQVDLHKVELPETKVS